MTLDQLRVFIAVAEREHLTKAADAISLTASAVSSAIKNLEDSSGIRLFDRVGRGIELTREGRAFLTEARETVARAAAAKRFLDDLGGVRAGHVDIQASQTIANYWLPMRIMEFRTAYPSVTIDLRIGNTTTTAEAVLSGLSELGFIEGELDQPALAASKIDMDKLVIVRSAKAQQPDGFDTGAPSLCKWDWISRERGSGTRSVFEGAMRAMGVEPADLKVTMTLPSNEAVLSAVRSGSCLAALSEVVVAPFVKTGDLVKLNVDLPPRPFTILRHKERRLSAAAREFEACCRASVERDTLN